MKNSTLKKIGTFLLSICIGLIKATPFGHIVNEIQSNIEHRIGNDGDKQKIDWTRMVVWVLATLLFIAKFFNLITIDDFEKIFDFALKSTMN